jgi:hypothetical protein
MSNDIKVEKRSMTPIPPQVEYTLTLNEHDANVLYHIAGFEHTIPAAIVDHPLGPSKYARDTMHSILVRLHCALGGGFGS